MGWQDRQYREPGSQGPLRRAFGRIFSDAENFLSWSVPLFRISGIMVRVHIFYVIFIAMELMWSMGSRLEFVFASMSMATLFVLVLLHEFGHCLACRRVGGEASEIIMWPLGGLAMCHPPNTARANMITVIGGPMVNVALLPVLGGVLLLMGASSDALVFNPLAPGGVLGTAWFSGPQFYLRVGVWWAYYMNLVLLGFNVLLPMFPMDGGRMLQCAMWSRMGYRQSMLKATFIGIVAACIVGLFAMTARGRSGNGAGNLLMVAVFCGFYSYSERRRVKMLDEFDSGYDAALEAQRARQDRDAQERASRRRERDQQNEAQRQAEIDRILEKIRVQGMASLTKAEQSMLRGETERKRRAL
ncbi:MAG: site-2 protease family protein [Phycisphaerales bacterium]